MRDTIKILEHNASHVKIDTEMHIYQGLYDHFAFRPKGYQYMPTFKAKSWDGYVRLMNTRARTLPIGLLPRLEKYASQIEADMDYSEYTIDDQNLSITYDEVKEFADSLNIHSKGVKITPHDYQIDAVYQAINSRRMVALAPTSAGKSLILYIYLNWFIQKKLVEKALLIVPSVQLVYQMFEDFMDYSSEYDINPETYCHLIMSGKEKQSDKPIYISTWQSLQNISKGVGKDSDSLNKLCYFQQFGVVAVDECFDPTTKILMENGVWKEIQNILPGDKIQNVDELGNIKTDMVIKQHKNISQPSKVKMYKLTMEDGSTIQVTGNHKLMTTLNVWKTVDELSEGDEILWVL